MLTRLKVTGFKNLLDVDVHFGPFTCVAGPNSVGKSNLFDAIQFLGLLSDRPLLEAALSVRGDTGSSSDVSSLFHSVDEPINFHAEMIVPAIGIDELGQPARAAVTFLEYRVSLRHKSSLRVGELPIEIAEEWLTHIKQADTRGRLAFEHSVAWRKSAAIGRRSGGHFISTDKERGIIRLHQDKGRSDELPTKRGGGRALQVLAATLPKTVLSESSATNPTACLAKQEMKSWRILQLEPAELRRPDTLTTRPEITEHGGGLPATLYRLATRDIIDNDSGGTAEESLSQTSVLSRIGSRLSELIDEVPEIDVRRDDAKQSISLFVRGDDKEFRSARSMSDGTLRFLALATLFEDPFANGVLCLEEPENGIHPGRISAMLSLLMDIAVDPTLEVNENNPLRQVITTTHSPVLVEQLPADSLLIARRLPIFGQKARSLGVQFCCLPGTWRASITTAVGNLITRPQLMQLLHPTLEEKNASGKRVVADVAAEQMFIPFENAS